MDATERALRQEMIAATSDIDLPSWMPAAVAAGGRRRQRRRQALLRVPAIAAVVTAVAGAGSLTYDSLLTNRDSDPATVVATAPAPNRDSPQTEPTPTPSSTATAATAAEQAAERAATIEAATEELNRERAHQEAQLLAQQLTAQGEPQLAAFYGAGYVYADAETLAAQWNVDPSEAKVTAGADLMAGKTLLIQPSEVAVPHTSPGWEVDAFTAAGYTDTDADKLAQTWSMDSWDAKVEAGKKLLAGDVLPISPGG